MVVARTAKNVISMRVDENGVLQVLANRKLSLEKVKEFVESKRAWVSTQIEDRAHSRLREDETIATISGERSGLSAGQIADVFNGKSSVLFGDYVLVRPSVESKCYLDGNCIFMPEKHFAQRDTRLKALASYLKKISVQNVSDAISKFGSNASLCPTKIEFKNVSGSWIKCTQPCEKVIALDYRVCQLPVELQRYLIVHAFAHFTNDGHDEDFWNTVSNYLPRYKTYAKQLQEYDFLKDVQ